MTPGRRDGATPSGPDYCTLDLTHNVVDDGVQFNVLRDDVRTACKSLGSKRRPAREQVALLDLARPCARRIMPVPYRPFADARA